MKTPLRAFVLGISLFLLSVAVLALEADPAGRGLWWIAFLPVVALYGVSGFIAIGGARAYAERRWSAVAGCAAASATITVLITLVAILLASRARIPMPPALAGSIVVATILVGAAVATFYLRQDTRERTEHDERG